MRKYLNNQHERDEFVIQELEKIPPGNNLLDAGCGSQRYRQYCLHLEYLAQDFGQYTVDTKKMIGSGKAQQNYKYGQLNYIGDIWRIDEVDNYFDSILCTEVLEHIPFPIETIREFGRLLKPEGRLILTAPSNCLRHMDPYFYYTGFSDRWYEKVLSDNGFKVERITQVGDYYRWVAVEIFRTAKINSIIAKIILLPAIIYYSLKSKTVFSENSLCMGYHVVAIKK